MSHFHSIFCTHFLYPIASKDASVKSIARRNLRLPHALPLLYQSCIGIRSDSCPTGHLTVCTMGQARYNTLIRFRFIRSGCRLITFFIIRESYCMTRSPLSRASARGTTRSNAIKLLLSNAFLGLSIVLLTAFLAVEMNGFSVDPLIPALAALSVGCSAVLDRLTPFSGADS